MMQAETSQEALNALVCGALPRQGCWGQEQYLWLTDRTRRLVEFTDGCVEELPVPTVMHQAILVFLTRLFAAYLEPRGGFALFAGLRVRTGEGRFREPDLAVLLDRSDPRNQPRYWLGADLVLEVVSEDDPNRDLVVKRAEYATAGINEYWIVDPHVDTITVLVLAGTEYVEHGVFRLGDTATSPMLDGFTLDVTAMFDYGQG
ncbi:MAG: Uma2 family endonuclease [Gammaproteobacteria bacterium]|nr:Uma2 family endonuclease [Gammaproteobacteria bacterium]